MKIRNEWMTDNKYFGEDYPNNILLDDAKYRFELQKQSLEGKNVLINDAIERIVIQNHTNPLNQAKYDKKISFDIGVDIHTGSILEFNDKKWMVVSKIFNKKAYKVASLLECNNILTYYDQNHTIHNIPCIVDSNTRFQDLRLEENKFISEPDDKITIRIAYNDITKNIERGQIFKLTDDNYKVISVNKVTEPGLIVLKMEYSVESAETHEYQLTILNGDILQIAQSQSLTINTKLTDNGIEVISPTILFSSSDDSVATIDSNGVVSVVGVGVVTFTVSLASDNTVNDSIVVEIVADEQNNYTYEILPTTSDITINQSLTFTANKYNNGVLVDGAEFTFEVIPGTTPSNAYGLTIISGNQCKITAIKAVYYITLRATDNSNGEYIDKQIRLKSLF